MQKDDELMYLMSEYGRDVWNFAFSLVRRREIADDIAQEVFIKVYKKLDSFRGESSAKTWLLAITRNIAMDYQRSSFLRKVILVDYIAEKGSHPSAETEVIGNQELNDTWNTVLQLPKKLREVMVLYVYHQLTVAEISDLLTISQSAVKVRLHRARKKFVAMQNKMEGEADGTVRV